MADELIPLRLAHSPDPDDAFMWWPLFELNGRPPRLDTGRFRFEQVMADIETLNRRSLEADYEITAISVAQYPHIKDRYAFTSCGSSMGDAYGPKLVARTPMTVDDLKDFQGVIAVPGRRTSAFATLSLMLGAGAFRHAEVEFDRIIEAVASGTYDLGLIIHEGQLTYEASGLHQVVDLGRWWTTRTGLPLPLGGNVIRRDLDALHGPGTLREITGLLATSLAYALNHRTASIDYALGYARDMEADEADRFVSMYVNAWTLDFGDRGQQAVRRFLSDLHGIGLIPDPGEVEFIAPNSLHPFSDMRKCP